MAEEVGPRRLQGVRVVGAGGLQKTDWFSKSDPYFVARVGVKVSTWADATFQVTSNAVKNCQDPGEEENINLCNGLWHVLSSRVECPFHLRQEE